MKGRHAKDSGAWRKVTLVAGVASTGAIPLSIMTAPTASAAPVSAWDRIAECESGGNWAIPYGDADSTGGLQIQQRTWNAYNGQQYAAQPYQATKEEQIAVAEKILARQGPGAWTCNAKVGYPLSSSGPNSSHLEGGAAPATPPAPKPSAPPTGGTYVVVPGDSLYLIAKNHGLGSGDDNWKQLYELNKDVIGGNPDLIMPGQKLELPGKAGKTKPAEPTGTGAAGVVAFVRAQLGEQYVLGGNGPSVWDCSGLTQAAYAAHGVHLPRVSQEQSLKGTPVAISMAQPGDLLYWGSPGSAHHVAVYIGNGRFIGAQNPGSGVVEHELGYSQPTGARRLF
jgi:resuscitation-promoting factor RpfA